MTITGSRSWIAQSSGDVGVFFYLVLSICHSDCGGAEDICVYKVASTAARWRTPSTKTSTITSIDFLLYSRVTLAAQISLAMTPGYTLHIPPSLSNSTGILTRRWILGLDRDEDDGQAGDEGGREEDGEAEVQGAG
jgi:hypothetical protein